MFDLVYGTIFFAAVQVDFTIRYCTTQEYLIK